MDVGVEYLPGIDEVPEEQREREGQNTHKEWEKK